MDLFTFDEKPTDNTEDIKSEGEDFENEKNITEGETEYEPRVKNTLTKNQIVEIFCNVE